MSEKKAFQTQVLELTEIRKQHLIWRLDRKTAMGLITAGWYATGKHGNLTLMKIFNKAGLSSHSAKIHSRKVLNVQSK